jgi:hypothetical protein
VISNHRDFSQREIWGDPSELSDAELSKAEQWWQYEVKRHPKGWAAIEHLNKVFAEKDKRQRQDRLSSSHESLVSEIEALREEIRHLRGDR